MTDDGAEGSVGKELRPYGPEIDFTTQFNIAREHLKVEKKLWTNLCELSKECDYKVGKGIGIMIVLGNFDISHNGIVHGMRQIGDSPIKKYVDVSSKNFNKEVDQLFRENYDGAIIINRTGQILGAKIYLTVDNPSLEVPEGTGTRHITAASFSKRDDVLAVFTLSEENGAVRIWKNGHFTEQFLPDEDEVEKSE